MSEKGHGGENLQELVRIEAALAGVRDACQRLVEENRSLRQDPSRPAGADALRLRALEARVSQLEAENRDLCREIAMTGRPDPLKEQEGLLANLYVAGFNLHRTMELSAVLASVKEILINLIGAEKFQIFLLEGERHTLLPIADEQSHRPSRRRVPVGEGIAGVVAKTGIPYFEADGRDGDFHNPLACVPMKVDGQVIGVLQVSRLFVQKKRLTSQDHELFSLLAETAGTALLGATLRQRAVQQEGTSALDWPAIVLPCLQIDDGGPQAHVAAGDAGGPAAGGTGRTN